MNEQLSKYMLCEWGNEGINHWQSEIVAPSISPQLRPRSMALNKRLWKPNLFMLVLRSLILHTGSHIQMSAQVTFFVFKLTADIHRTQPHLWDTWRYMALAAFEISIYILIYCTQRIFPKFPSFVLFSISVESSIIFPVIYLESLVSSLNPLFISYHTSHLPKNPLGSIPKIFPECNLLITVTAIIWPTPPPSLMDTTVRHFQLIFHLLPFFSPSNPFDCFFPTTVRITFLKYKPDHVTSPRLLLLSFSSGFFYLMYL